MDNKRQAKFEIAEDEKVDKAAEKKRYAKRVLIPEMDKTISKVWYEEVTPSLCTEPTCLFDAATELLKKKIKINEFGNVEYVPKWGNLNETQKAEALELLAEHKATKHRALNSFIVDEEELKEMGFSPASF